MKTTSLRIVGSTTSWFGRRTSRMLWTMIGMLLVATALSLNAQPALSSAGGLVGHWNFDEGSGSVAADSSGFGNDGQLVEGTTWWQSPSLARVALFFDGVNDHVSVRNSPSLNPSAEITLAAWIAPYDVSTSGEIIAKSNGTDPQYYLRVQAGGKIRFGIGSTVLNGNTTLSSSQWHHVSGTYDGSTMKIYVDGVLDAVMNRNGPMHDNGVDVWIGCRRFQTLLAFYGLIDDPQIYNRALSANEIQALVTPGQVVITSVNNQTFLSGSLFGWVFLDLTADVFNFAAPVAKVDYYDYDQLIGTATQAPYDVGLYYVIQAFGGTHYIDAVATDTLGNVVRTAPFAFWYNICDFFVYNRDLLPFICRITSPDPRSVFAYGDPIRIDVSTYQPCSGMFDGIDLLGLPFPVHLDGGDGGTFVWENAPLGFHSISARTTGPGPYSFDADPIDINVVANHLGRPANDDFADSFDLAQITTGNNVNATRELVEPPRSPSSGHSVWWYWTAPSDGWVVFSTEGSSFDTVVVSFPGNSIWPPPWIEISGNLLFATAGTTYHIMVDGVPGAWGYIQLNVRYDIPPTISLISPRNGDVFPQGTPIHFEATASDGDGSIAKVRFVIDGGLNSLNQNFVVDASPFAFDWTPPFPGQYVILVCSVDNDGVETCTPYGELSFTVQGSRPLVRITSPVDRQLFDAGTTSITFQTATSVSNGFIAKVDFYLDSVGLLGTVTNAPFELTWSPTTPCAHGLTVIATDNFGVSSVPSDPNSIGAVYFAVEPNYPESPAITISQPQDGASLTAGQAIWISADLSNNCRPADQVEFYAFTPSNTKKLVGVYPFVSYGYSAWIYWTDPTPGDYILTARAVFGSHFVDSPGVHITVQASGPSVSIISPADRQIFDAGTTSITFQTDTSFNGGLVAGVDFYVDNAWAGATYTAPFDFAWSPTGPCGHWLQVRATDNLGIQTLSRVVYFALEPSFTEAPAINLFPPQDGASFTAGQPILILAQPSNYCRPPDQVEFYAFTPPNTKTLLGAVPGVALQGCCFSHWMYWSDATPGDYALTARGVFGSNFVDSPAVHITVTP